MTTATVNKDTAIRDVFFNAIRSNSPSHIVSSLLTIGCDPNWEDSDNNSALTVALKLR